jgi:hypothetical protein
MKVVNKQYFLCDCRLDQDDIPQPFTLQVREEVFAACFTAKKNKILASNGNGIINVSCTENAIFQYECCRLFMVGEARE